MKVLALGNIHFDYLKKGLEGSLSLKVRLKEILT